MSKTTVRLQWEDEEHTILRYEFDPDWRLADFEAAYQEATDRIEALSHPVYVIVNVGEYINLPPGFFLSAHRMQHMIPDNLALCAVVARGPMLEMLYRVLKRFAPLLAAFVMVVPTLECAHDRVARHRSDNAAGSD